MLNVFRIFLTSAGYCNIQTFADSRKALKHLIEMKNQYRYGLAIIDIRMPNINGIQVFQILKIINPAIKVLFITALDAVDELISIFPQIKSDDIIRKPIEQQQFITIVNDALSKT